VGKTALLEYAVESASDLRLVRVVGIESEMELAFAALHQLCAPMLDQLERLPRPQRDALATTFGLSAAGAADPFLVGLAVLSLLSDVAEEHRLLCVVDDAQWLDRASARALGFAARRLLAESVAMVFAAREPADELRGLPELVVHGLRNAHARELLSSAMPWPLDERVRERILTEARGNPLALLELPRGLTPTELAGGFGLLGALSLSDRVEESFKRRLDALPEDAQQLLLVAAVEPTGDPVLLWRAARRLAISDTALTPVESAGLLAIGARVRFRHPLARSAVYRAASPQRRRRVHRALAEATNAEIDPDRRAWHLAESTAGPDEEVAAELERSAGRAGARGGLAAAGAFLERAVALTPGSPRRAKRALAAAQAKVQAGAFDDASGLLSVAEAGPLDELGRAQVDLLRAQVALAQNRGSDAPPLLLRAARRLEPLDARLARATYRDALEAATWAGSSAEGVGVTEVARAALAAPPPSHRLSPVDLLLKGVATQCTTGYAEGVPMVKRALGALRDGEIPAEEQLEWGVFTYRAAVDLWDDDSWHLLATRNVKLARETGALTALQLALNALIVADAFAGELTAGTSLMDELQTVSEATASHIPPYSALALAAWGGREVELSKLVKLTTGDVLPRGEALGLSAVQWARSVLCNGLGRYEEALDAAERAIAYQDLGFSDWSLAELIVAAAHSAQPERAAGALQHLAARAHACQSEWALGIEARSRALLSDGEAAEGLFREAVDRLARTRMRTELARAHLDYGEWLRRERRRQDAREQLHTAHEMFATIGMEAFARRAEHELLATGERARKRTVETRDDLTGQERQIALLARDGLSNPEIGARMFISPRTAEYHLHKVFNKLNISSRAELVRALPPEPGAALAV
jgi:DNA-binding CsgD family transcriptional regulator